jgi:hypothetical protein
MACGIDCSVVNSCGVYVCMFFTYHVCACLACLSVCMWVCVGVCVCVCDWLSSLHGAYAHLCVYVGECVCVCVHAW